MRQRRSGLATMAIAILGLCVAALTPAPSAGQVGVSPTDSAGVLFEAARDFEREGRPAVAEALYRLILRRFPSTPAAVEARAALGLIGSRDTSDGSTELRIWGTLFGAWLGVAVPGAFGADEPEPYGVGLLLGGPLGFVASRAVARRTDLTVGQARAITWGGTWGAWQGFGWREVLDIGEDAGDCLPQRPCFDGDTSEETFTAMIAGSAVGAATGALLSRRSITDAQATAANLGALWGSWFGVAAGILGDLEDDDLLAATLVGGDVLLAAAALGAPSLGWSRNRWRLVSIGGLLGGVAGLGINLLAEIDDDKAFVAIPLAASLTGLALGVGLSSDGDREDVGPADGALLELEVGSGGLSYRGLDRVRLGTPAPSLRQLPVERDGSVRWRTTLGVNVLRVGF